VTSNVWYDSQDGERHWSIPYPDQPVRTSDFIHLIFTWSFELRHQVRNDWKKQPHTLGFSMEVWSLAERSKHITHHLISLIHLSCLITRAGSSENSQWDLLIANSLTAQLSFRECQHPDFMAPQSAGSNSLRLR